MEKTASDKELDELAKIDPFQYSNSGIVACIGDNCGQQVGARDFSIADGYKATVDLLYRAMTNRSNFYRQYNVFISRDTLVYPFWFCCLHTMELYLKLAVKRLNWIWMKKKTTLNVDQLEKYKKAIRSHKINELIELFIDLVVIDIDTKYAFTQMKNFEEYLKDYFFDEDADAFRYTFKSNQNDINLEGKRIINLTVLYAKFEELYKQLDWFCNYIFAELFQDYKTKTFTKNLNRNQIFEISKKLPAFQQWNEDSFDDTKKSIKAKYNINSRELTQVLEFIKTIPYFSANINKEITLGSIISKDVFTKLIELKKIQQQIDSIPSKTMGIDLLHPENSYEKEDFEKRRELQKILDEKSIEFIQSRDVSHSILSTLLTFIELGSSPIDGRYYCEDFNEIYRYWNEECGSHIGSIGEINYTIGKLLNINDLKLGFEKCGQKTYLSWLNENYSENYVYK